MSLPFSNEHGHPMGSIAEEEATQKRVGTTILSGEGDSQVVMLTGGFIDSGDGNNTNREGHFDE